MHGQDRCALASTLQRINLAKNQPCEELQIRVRLPEGLAVEPQCLDHIHVLSAGNAEVFDCSTGCSPAPGRQPGSRLTRLYLSLVFLCVPMAGFSETWKTGGGFSDDYANVPITVEPLRDNIHFIHASGGNMVLAVGEDGALLVDNEFVELNERLQEAIRKLSPKALRYVFNTHWHWDHTGMNEALAGTGAVILAHDQSRARMLAPQYHAFFHRLPPPERRYQ